VKLRYFAGALALSAAIAVAACGDDPPPTQPTPAPVAPPPPANPVLTAPSPDAPGDDEQLTTLRPRLVVRKATSDQVGPRSYEFQISDDPDFQPASASSLARFYKVVVTQAGVAEGPADATFEVGVDLQPATRFFWHARARQGTTDGPFSATRTFRTRVLSYNIDGELYDPLTTGTTVGTPVGSFSLVPGRGYTNNNNESHMRYNLVRTIQVGQFSFEADGITRDNPGDKTKMMSMFNGDGDITDSNWRMTVEKRDAGVVAWRFIAGRPGGATQIDTEGSSERIPVNFNPGTTYFWRATWGGGFDLNIFEGGVGGNRIYAFGKSMGATYNPQPHAAYLGSVVGRAGPDSASVPGVTYRNVYIADQSKPRPASLGTATIENINEDPRIKYRGIRQF
jgi:hypothetical protein